MAAKQQMVRVRWEGNNSRKYNGRVQDITVKFVEEEEDVNRLTVGAVVRVQWGRQMRRWRAVVVDLLRGESSPDMADTAGKPAKKRASEKPPTAAKPPARKRPKVADIGVDG